MIEVGRICVKLAGRDAGRECVIVDILDNSFVLIDGNVRRRKCNILHLEPSDKKIELKKGASHEEVSKEFGKLKIDVWETKAKEKKEKPKKVRKKKVKEVKEDKGKKKVKEVTKKDAKKDKKTIDAEVVSVTEKKPKVKKEVKKETKEGK